MPAPVRVILNEEEDRTLRELRLATTVPQRTRDRAHMVRLNAQGWNAPALADMFECCEHTVRATLKRWQTLGLGGLWDAPGRGNKPRWQQADLEYLEGCLEQEPRTYNSEQLAQKLREQRQVTLSADRVRRLLKKRGFAGSVPATATSTSKTLLPNGSSKPTSTP
jgi:transposase